MAGLRLFEWMGEDNTQQENNSGNKEGRGKAPTENNYLEFYTHTMKSPQRNNETRRRRRRRRKREGKEEEKKKEKKKKN